MEHLRHFLQHVGGSLLTLSHLSCSEHKKRLLAERVTAGTIGTLSHKSLVLLMNGPSCVAVPRPAVRAGVPGALWDGREELVTALTSPVRDPNRCCSESSLMDRWWMTHSLCPHDFLSFMSIIIFSLQSLSHDYRSFANNKKALSLLFFVVCVHYSSNWTIVDFVWPIKSVQKKIVLLMAPTLPSFIWDWKSR